MHGKRKDALQRRLFRKVHDMAMKIRKYFVCFMATVVAIFPVTAYAENLSASPGQAFGSPALATEALDTTRFGALDVQTQMMLGARQSDESFTPTGGAVTMMTAYIVLRESELSARVEITDEMLNPRGISAGFESGDTVSVQDLLATMLLEGAQDSATALAVHVAGSSEAFVQKMNQYASDLGMEDTTYTSATGAFDASQRTTVADLLRLAYALYTEYGTLDLFSSARIATASLPDEVENRVVLLDSQDPLYDSRVLAAFGAGSSTEEGFNTILVAQAGEMEVLLVYCSDNREETSYQDISLLFDQLEDTFHHVDITEPALALFSAPLENGVAVEAQAGSPLVVSATMDWQLTSESLRYELVDESPTAREGEAYATAQLYVEDQLVGSVPLIRLSTPDNTLSPSPESTSPATSAELYEKSDEQYQPSNYDKFGWVYWTIGAVVFCGVLLIIHHFVFKKLK